MSTDHDERLVTLTKRGVKERFTKRGLFKVAVLSVVTVGSNDSTYHLVTTFLFSSPLYIAMWTVNCSVNLIAYHDMFIYLRNVCEKYEVAELTGLLLVKDGLF